MAVGDLTLKNLFVNVDEYFVVHSLSMGIGHIVKFILEKKNIYFQSKDKIMH